VADIRKSREVLHLVYGGAHGHLQHHAVVRHATLGVVVRVVFSCVPNDPEPLHVVCEGPRDERVQPHGEGTPTAKPFGPAVDVADVGVGAKRDVFVEPGEGHVVEEARRARNSGEVAGIVKLHSAVSMMLDA
jgi:hypothetical protein